MENIYVAGGIYYKNSDPATGEFKLVHPTGQHPYITHKMEGVNATQAEIIATANPGCMLQLQAGVRMHGNGQRVMHVVEVLDLAYKNAK